MVCDSATLLNQAIRDGKTVMFEGAQGTMLDIDHGTYPFVTSSSASAGGACTGTGVAPTRITGVIGVSKAYITRVGGGPFSYRGVGRRGRPHSHARKRVRRRHWTAPAVRLVRRSLAAIHRGHQRIRQHRDHEARCTGRTRAHSRLRGLSDRRPRGDRDAAPCGGYRKIEPVYEYIRPVGAFPPSASLPTTNFRPGPRTIWRSWKLKSAWRLAASPQGRNAIRLLSAPARGSRGLSGS